MKLKVKLKFRMKSLSYRNVLRNFFSAFVSFKLKLSWRSTDLSNAPSFKGRNVDYEPTIFAKEKNQRLLVSRYTFAGNVRRTFKKLQLLWNTCTLLNEKSRPPCNEGNLGIFRKNPSCSLGKCCVETKNFCFSL